MIYGCGLHHTIDTPTKKGAWRLTLNITAPYMPITTDGKEPDLQPAVDAIRAALAVAIKKAHRNTPKKETSGEQMSVVFDSLEEAVSQSQWRRQAPLRATTIALCLAPYRHGRNSSRS